MRACRSRRRDEDTRVNHVGVVFEMYLFRNEKYFLSHIFRAGARRPRATAHSNGCAISNERPPIRPSALRRTCPRTDVPSAPRAAGHSVRHLRRDTPWLMLPNGMP